MDFALAEWKIWRTHPVFSDSLQYDQLEDEIREAGIDTGEGNFGRRHWYWRKGNRRVLLRFLFYFPIFYGSISDIGHLTVDVKRERRNFFCSVSNLLHGVCPPKQTEIHILNKIHPLRLITSICICLGGNK